MTFFDVVNQNSELVARKHKSKNVKIINNLTAYT